MLLDLFAARPLVCELRDDRDDVVTSKSATAQNARSSSETGNDAENAWGKKARAAMQSLEAPQRAWADQAHTAAMRSPEARIAELRYGWRGYSADAADSDDEATAAAGGYLPPSFDDGVDSDTTASEAGDSRRSSRYSSPARRTR